MRHLLELGPKISPPTMRSVQMDERDPFAATLVPYLVRISLRKDRFTRQAQDLLRDWDFSSGAKSAPTAYYNAVWANLLRLTFDDELSGDRQADGGDRWYSVVDILLKD